MTLPGWMIGANKEWADDPRAQEALLEALLANSPAGVIENQEAREQQRLVAASLLPVELLGDLVETDLEEMGFKLGPEVKDDELFRHVVFPEGWKLVPSDHSMWSDVVDAEGVVRLNVFYKGAFYDRRAHVRLASQ